ncbi:MAG: hypothetical protein WC284_09660 [Candidimonas sp.]
MILKDIIPHIDDDIKDTNHLIEYASSGSTSAGNIASIPGGLWTGKMKGEYPYQTPDYEAHGLQPMSLRLGQTGATMADKPKRKKRKKKKST